MRRKVVFVDLDSTLASTWDRRHLINWDDIEATDWRAYAMACADDTVFPAVRKLVLDYRSLFRVVIVTGRHEDAKEATRAWLRTHGIGYDGLIMRPDGDRRPNEEFKIAAIREWCEMNGDQVYLLIDDWPPIVEKASEYGWDVLLVNPNYPVEESKSNRATLTGLPV